MSIFEDPILLSRIQFAFTISFHILFPAFTIGLASWLVVIEGVWLKTKQPVYKELYMFWVKIFAITFGMGVVTGLVMSYQFGTNWSAFSDKVGNVIGPLLAYEVLTAFFLEASFLGIMIFGWNRVSPRMHFISTLIVAVGTTISAFWILSANSWMQTPQGFYIGENGIFYPSNWLEVIFNPSFPFRLFHMLIGAFLTTAFAVGGTAAFYLLKRKSLSHARIMFFMAMLMALFIAPLQLVVGHEHGRNTLKHQPAKVAAMEGIWENEKGAALRVFGFPSETEERTLHSLEIPKLASLILTGSLDGEIQGLKSWAPSERPPVSIVFWSFRIMVGIGILMILTGIMALILFLKKKLFHTKWFLRWCIALTPSGFIAILSGWFVTEVGRQPYIVYGALRTIEAASPVSEGTVSFSLLLFVVVYLSIFGAAVSYIIRILRKGPESTFKHLSSADNSHFTLADIFPKKERR